MAEGRMNSLDARVPSDGGTKLFGASPLSFLTNSTAYSTTGVAIISALIESTALVDMLRHACEDLVYLVRSGVGRDVDLEVDVDSRRLELSFDLVRRRCPTDGLGRSRSA